MINDVFNRFIDRAKGEIEAWSQRGSGWVMEGILDAFVNVAPLDTNNFGKEAICLSQKMYKIREQSSTSKTETISVLDGHFVLFYFQHQEPKTR